MIDRDRGARGAGEQDEQRLDAAAARARIVDRAEQEEDADRHDRDALENAQGARLIAARELLVERVAIERCASEKAGGELRTERPAERIHSAPRFSWLCVSDRL